jgi:two-component system, NarL family, sensor kinase
MYKKFLLLFLILYLNVAYSQTPTAEKLKKDYNIANNEAEKLATLIKVCSFTESFHTDTLLVYAYKMKVLVEKEDNIGKNALADFYIGSAILKKGLADSALNICSKGLQGLNYNNDYKQSFIKLKRLEGSIAIRKQEYQKALEIFFPLLNDALVKKDTFYIVNNLSTIGYTYMEMAQNKEAIDWFQKSLVYESFADTKKYLGKINSNIAAVYNELNQNDSAEIYILKGIKLNEAYEQLSALANSYAIYSDILTDTKRITQAEEPLLKAIEIRKQIGEPYFIVSDMAQLGIFYAINNQTKKGITICEEGIKIAKQFNINAKLPFLYSTLAQNYKAANNKEDYINTLEKIITLKDSIYTMNSEKAIAESKTKYDAVNQELKLVQTKKEVENGRTKLFFSIATLISAFALFLFIWKRKSMK